MRLEKRQPPLAAVFNRLTALIKSIKACQTPLFIRRLAFSLIVYALHLCSDLNNISQHRGGLPKQKNFLNNANMSLLGVPALPALTVRQKH